MPGKKNTNIGRQSANAKRKRTERNNESDDERNKRLQEARHRISTLRDQETNEESEKRLNDSRVRASTSRGLETDEKYERRMNDLRDRISISRAQEMEEERERKLKDLRDKASTSRCQETDEEDERRLKDLRDRTSIISSQETDEKCERRISSFHERINVLLINESQEAREKRLQVMRERIMTQRNEETESEREVRLQEMRERVARMRDSETMEERETRLQEMSNRINETRMREWRSMHMAAFSYDKNVNYQSDIKMMTVVCQHCSALKWERETPGMCCANGKVRLPFLQRPPEPLNSPRNREFLKHIRAYNGAFQMTSFGAQVIREGTFMPIFKIQGQIYHRIGSLLPTDGDAHKFLQIYFTGNSSNELDIRCNNYSNLDRNILSDIQDLLHEHNTYIRQLKTTLERHENIDNFKLVIHADRHPADEHRGRYNPPTCDDIAVVVVGENCDRRDIVINYRDNTLQRIYETHRSYDCLQYPVIFCRGEDGYHFQMYLVNPSTGVPTNKKISCLQYYAYHIQVRSTESHLHHCRALFQQFLVDMYVKVETERLIFIKMNQTKLRSENYIHLQDAVHRDGHANNVGQMVILPSSFTGGPRYMHEKTQDAMTYVRSYGRPDLFITFTTNPKWKEIAEGLYHGQSANERPDIIARVFHLKVKKLLNMIIKGQIFGPHRCYMYTIEWQKRGLPHVHILLWLTDRIRPQQIDSLISAEIPNSEEDHLLHDVVKSCMIHGPCGHINLTSPCMVNGKCSKHYPRKFTTHTKTDNNGYPLYRRRSVEEGGFTATLDTRSGSVEVDNRWVVPYCPVLSRAFQPHINVESCNSVRSIKYVCKYINKGSDKATISISDTDEVQIYQNGRYVSSSEAAWRLLEFPIHERYPPVFHLQVHLENGERVFYETGIIPNINSPPRTTLTAFFHLCETDEFARGLYYHEVPQYYTFSQQKTFQPRKRGTIIPDASVRKADVLGRVYIVHPNNSECYYLRMLLHEVRGPKSFRDLRTVNNNVYATYQEACQALGLLEDDQQWDTTLEEASVTSSARSLRYLFGIMLNVCNLTNAAGLWEKHKESLSEDVLHNARTSSGNFEIQYSDEVFNESLCLLEDVLLNMGGKNLKDFNMPEAHRDQNLTLEFLTHRELQYDVPTLLSHVDDNEPRLTGEQMSAYHLSMESSDNNLGKIFFLDAPGGTGKTFLINLILSKVRSQRKIALAVASSGIAATLLEGGRTAYSMFKFPLNLSATDTPTCNISRGSMEAKLLMKCNIIIWDECTMCHKLAIEALSTTLQDLYSDTSKKMGNITVVFSGDFRQTLPVVPRGTRADEVSASLKSSSIWPHVTMLQLKTNMRVQLHGDQESAQFAGLILDIGNGTASNNDSLFEIPDHLGTIVDSINVLVNCVYPDVHAWEQKPISWWCERSILAPKNDTVRDINTYVLSLINNEECIYSSIDTVVDQDKAVEFPVEFLNSLELPELPPHKLKLKIGAVVMLLRNLDAPRLCNGTRLRITHLQSHVIQATIMTGCAAGESVFIPRIPLIPTDSVFEFKRLQYPVRLSFAITINKSQGQTLAVVGIDLRNPCFSHGQFYVACSRTYSKNNLYFLMNGTTTHNIVYPEALSC